jgi:hypothetical protein
LAKINEIFKAISDGKLAEVGRGHDDFRMRHSLEKNTVDSFQGFENSIGDYFKKHYDECFTRGGDIPLEIAISKAKQTISQAYRRKNGNITTAFTDCKENLNGGLRVVLDLIADSIKQEAIEMYIRQIFDSNINPTEYDEKLSIIKEFIHHYGYCLSPSIKTGNPNRFANDYEELIRSFVNNLRGTSSLFNRF